MHPFQWCNGCFCGLGLVSTNKSCSMPPISFQDLPLNIYMVIFGTGIFVFMLSLIFCCYFISKLRNQAQSERYGYKEVVLKGDAKKLQLYGQTCAVCLEDFKGKDELGVLPCQHAFHRKCLVKWLEVRCVCPMCNKPIAGPSEASQSIGILLDELVPAPEKRGNQLSRREPTASVAGAFPATSGGGPAPTVAGTQASKRLTLYPRNPSTFPAVGGNRKKRSRGVIPHAKILLTAPPFLNLGRHCFTIVRREMTERCCGNGGS
ncbi:hypothetical protein R6Z07F_019535 [Ovis aries]